MRSSSFLTSPQVLVVEASAGSGKTYTLAKRYVQLCLHLGATQPLAIQSILAITFTNRATWSMKSRILDFFKRISLKQLKPFEVQDILVPLGLDEEAAAKLGQSLMNGIIRQYHYFQVQTIDSFVNILLVGCAFKVGLSARFKIQRNSQEYLQLALDELLDQAHSDKQTFKLFEDFVRQFLFLENRSGWFPKEDLLKVMRELFRQYNTYQRPLLTYLSSQDHFARKKKIYGLMQELKSHCPAQTAKKFLGHLDELLARDQGHFDVDELSSYWTREEFPVNKGGEVSGKTQQLWRRITDEISGLCLEEARGMFNAYVVLFERSLSAFARLSRRDDVLFLEELNRKAALLFDNNLVTVEELYFRLAARFQHYLVDEFQDTSLSQWRNLATMVEEALAQGGSLFYVGDKKQAIYSFRGGESRLFDALQRQLVDFNVQTTSLEKNYRSCPEIIKFNNQVFGLDNLQAFLERRLEDSQENKRPDVHFSQKDFETIANTFAHTGQVPGKDLKGGIVRVVHLEGRTKQERSEEVRQRLMALLGELRGRFALKDIAILTRGNDEVEEITQWLLQEGVHASSERSSDVKNNPLIAELISLLSFLHVPVDNNAFAQVCLGELVPKATGLSPQALQDFLFDCAVQSKRMKDIIFYKEFQKVFPKVWEDFFESFLQQAGVLPLYELTAGVMQRFGCERFFPQYQGFFMHLLELIKTLEKESCDLPSFLDYFAALEGEDRFVPMAQVNAVKVTTVHKAKGLEFPVVIVPFLEMDIKAGSGGRDGSQAYVLDIQQEGMGLVRLKESYRRFCPPLQSMYEQEYKKSFLVELNSVYVALTRAIEELYVFIPAKVGNTVNPAKFLIPQECLASGTPAQRPAAHEPQTGHQKIKPFLSDPWLGLQEELFHEPPKSAALAAQGEFYHELLMHIGNLSTAGMDETLPPEIQAFIDRPDVRRFFYLPADAQIFCEKEFVNKYGDTKRIDRLMVLKDEVWIVDYKLSRGDEGEHEKQMQGYIELIKSFYPKHKVSGRILYLN